MLLNIISVYSSVCDLKEIFEKVKIRSSRKNTGYTYSLYILYIGTFQTLAIIEFQWRGPNGLIAMVGRMVSLCTVCGTSCY